MASKLLRKKCPSTREKRDLLNEMPWRAGHTVRRRGSDVVKKKCNHRKWIIRRLTHSYVSTFHRSRLLLCAQWTPEKIEKKKWKGTFSLRVSANINKWKDCDDDDDDYDDWWCYSGASSLAWKATGGGKSSGGAESKSNPAPWLAPGNGLPFLFYFISFYSFFVEQLSSGGGTCRKDWPLTELPNYHYWRVTTWPLPPPTLHHWRPE